MTILLAEDEADLAQLTIEFLECENIECDYASDGAMALNLLANNDYQVLVLDVNMPKLNGFALCQTLKAQGNNTPVLFLTARDGLDDKLKGFELGADDYLTKPFELEELVARIKVLSQRTTAKSPVFNLDSLQIDFDNRQVSRCGVNLDLSINQWQALELLAKNSPNVVTRTALEDAIWPHEQPGKEQLKMLLFRLRNLIDGQGQAPLLQTIRGVGVALRANTVKTNKDSNND